MSALYEILMRRHNQRVYRTIRAILRDDRDVEDVMQQAYVDAYTHLDQFRGTAKFSTWLTRIAVNRAIRIGRGARRGPELAPAPGDHALAIEQTAATMPDPEHTLYGRELKVVLESLIERLPDSFRVVFVMREVEGLSTAETAACLEVNEETVKTRLHRAKRLLKRSTRSPARARHRPGRLSVPPLAMRSRGRRRHGGHSSHPPEGGHHRALDITRAE